MTPELEAQLGEMSPDAAVQALRLLELNLLDKKFKPNILQKCIDKTK